MTSRDAIHARYRASPYAQAAAEADQLRDDPEELAEIRAVNEELDRISGRHSAGDVRGTA